MTTDEALKAFEIVAEQASKYWNENNKISANARLVRSFIAEAARFRKAVEEMREKVNTRAHEKEKFSERKWWLACVGVLDALLNGGKE